jgi:lipoprotein-releasing system permease protein
MNFSYYTARRLALGQKSFSSFIMRTGICAIAISIAVMILAVGITGGYKKEITEKITGFNAHITIKSRDFNESHEARPVPADLPYIGELKKIKEVTEIQIYANKAGIIKTEQDIEGIIIKGIDSNYNTQFLKESLIRGKIPAMSDSLPSDAILISRYTADKLRLDTGTKINIFFLQDQSQPVRVRRLSIAGIFETGLDDYDKTFAVADIRHIQKIYGWKENEAEGLEIKIGNFKDLVSVTEKVGRLAPPEYDVLNARDIKPQIFDWLALLDTNVAIILILMVLVAAINIITSLLILMLERTNMIGILKALGARDRQIRKIFLWKAAYLILTGLLIGNTAGIGLGLLQHYSGFIRLDQESYYLTQVPFIADWKAIFLVNAGTFLFCLLVLLLPSRLIGKLSPVKAIRFD